MTPSTLPSILAMIRMLAAQGYGYEDIGIRLNIPRDHVRPHVIKERPS